MKSDAPASWPGHPRASREIAHELFLSRRTADMHVRNIFGKLDCRSRVAAIHRARKLGLIA